jgi:hypothetical protein
MLILALVQAIHDIPPGWASIWSAIVEVVGPTLVGAALALMGWMLRRLKHIQDDTAAARKDAAAAKQSSAVTEWHTANAHLDPNTGLPINQRDDMDQKHEQLLELFEGVNGRFDNVERDIRGMQRDIGRLADADLEQVRKSNRMQDHLDELERTRPKPE